MQLSALSLAMTRVMSGAYTPSALFAAGEQGVYFDPSDTATLFQDAAGTTPVTAMEQPVGLMLDKSKGLVLGPERAPLVTSLTGWNILNAPANGSVTTEPGGIRYTANGNGILALATSSILTSTKTYKVVLRVSDVYGVFCPEYGPGGESVTINTAGTYTYKINGRNNFYFRNVGAAAAGCLIEHVSIRELHGNHCTFKAGTGRPVLSARYNLLTYTEQFDNAAWIKGASAITPDAALAPNGTTTADKLTESATSGSHYVQQTVLTAGGTYTVTIYAKAAERTHLCINEAGVNSAIFNLATGTIESATNCTATILHIKDGWYKCAWNKTATYTELRFNTSTASGNVYLGDGTSGIYIWGADVRPTNDGIGLPAYQRVVDSSTYDTAGFPPYLRADGTDDGGSTNSIDFTGTDKVTVFAGVRKLSDATTGMLCELSSTYVNDGSFAMLVPPNTGLARYGVSTRGTTTTALQASSPYSHAAPITSVLSAALDNAQGAVAANAIKIRHNGSAMPSASDGLASTTPANYGNYPLYLFGRASTNLYFNGRLYGLIVLGRAATATEIANTERYLNMKAKVY